MGNGKVRAVGVGMAMQGSCISNVDVGSATIMLNEDGTYKLAIAAADMGTGCDTILAQMAAGMSACDHRRDLRLRRGHDSSPYVPAPTPPVPPILPVKAVVKAATELEKRICQVAAGMLECDPEDVEFDGQKSHRCENRKIRYQRGDRLQGPGLQRNRVTGDRKPQLPGIAASLYGRRGGNRAG